MRFPSLLALLAISAAHDVRVFHDHDCTASSELAASPMTVSGTWLNLCEARVGSVLLPSSVSVGFFAQCRFDDVLARPGPGFSSLITTPPDSTRCVNVNLDHPALSLAFVDSMAEVCNEHVKHIDHFCVNGACSDDCMQSLAAGRQVAAECKNHGVAQWHFANHYEESSSPSWSSSEDEGEHGPGLVVDPVLAKAEQDEMDDGETMTHHTAPRSLLRHQRRQHRQERRLARKQRQSSPQATGHTFPVFVNHVGDVQEHACNKHHWIEGVFCAAFTVFFIVSGVCLGRRCYRCCKAKRAECRRGRCCSRVRADGAGPTDHVELSEAKEVP